MKETKETTYYQEFQKIMKNPPCRLNMELDELLQDRYNNNSYNLYQRNELALLKKKDHSGELKNLLSNMWKEESEEIKEFFKILAIEGNRRFKLRNQKSRSKQPPPQPQPLKKKLPLLLPRLPLLQPHVYYQPQSYEYYQPQPLFSPQLQPDEYWKMQQLPDESHFQPQHYQPQQLPIHYEQCVPEITLTLRQPQLQPQLSPIPPQPFPQQYVNCQPISHEDNQSQPLPSPSQLQLDESWLSDEFYLPIPQPLLLQQPELLLDNEHEQPQSPLSYDDYFNNLE